MLKTEHYAVTACGNWSQVWWPHMTSSLEMEQAVFYSCRGWHRYYHQIILLII